MRLPRDLTGQDLAKALEKLGYGIERQTGSHMRLTTLENAEHHNFRTLILMRIEKGKSLSIYIK